MTIVWFRLALYDLDHLRSYISQESPRGATLVVNRVLDAVESLTAFPERGRAGRVGGTRELVVPRTPFIVAYRREGESIQILRVLHGARRWPAL